MAAELALGRRPLASRTDITDCPSWPEDLAEVVHIDHYGNAVSGMRAFAVAPDARIRIGGITVPPATHYAAHSDGESFWYQNANGLIEIAAARASAADRFGLTVGARIELLTGIKGQAHQEEP